MSYLINVYCTVKELPELDFPHKLNSRRDLSDPELGEHLNGFTGYVMNRCGGGDGQMTQSKYYVYRHLQRTRHHLSLNVEEKDFPGFVNWGWQANAICFQQDGTVTDPSCFILVGPDCEEPEDDAQLPFPPDAVARKLETDQLLEEKNIMVPASLPPVVAETEVEIRPADEVARRALALFQVCVRAESLAEKDEIPFSQLKKNSPLGCASLSPLELEFMKAESAEQREIIAFSWRYEALFLLQWAMGMVDELPYPSAICDVPALAKRMVGIDEQAFIDNAKLRPAKEILDTLDLHYRLNWLVHEAGKENLDNVKDLEAGVVHERHYALNWLTGFEDADWDYVDTPS